MTEIRPMCDSDNAGRCFHRSELCLTTPYEPPVSSVETQLAELWQRVLNVDVIGTHDDFFEIGGDSVAAAVLAGELETLFGCNFNPSHMIDHSTIADQAVYIDAQKGASHSATRPLFPYLTLFNAGGAKAPLFIVHGNRGFTILKKQFLDGFDPEQPIGFLEAPGLDGEIPPMANIEHYAACYLEAIRQVAPEGNWQVAANCAGALIGFEMGIQAEKSGERVSRLMMIDPIDGRRATSKRWRRKKNNARPKKGIAGLWSRAMDCLALGHASDGGEEFAYEASVEDFNLRRRHFEKRINSRLQNNGDHFVPSRIAYSAEAMQNVCLALDNAYRLYVVEERWHGQAFILTCRPRAKGLRHWGRYMPNMRCRIVDHTHQTLFDAGVPVIHKFIEDSLAPDPMEHFES